MHCALAQCKCTVQIEAYDYLLAWRGEQRPMVDGVGPAGSHEFLGGVRVGEPVGGGSRGLAVSGGCEPWQDYMADREPGEPGPRDVLYPLGAGRRRVGYTDLDVSPVGT